ncbi:hypothetical protein [Maribellus sediminis]|uniref:hypothetical protein n=1 Tax=Maribellus sediminis TaxID=2696285 RepID=UPI00142FB51D|nr:hypothetical protein [Maribellus sediminis]
MKRVFFLLIGILILCVACQDDFVEPENAPVTKSAKYERTKTFELRGHVSSIPDFNGPFVSCLPEGSGLVLAETGWVSGQVNILGQLMPEKCTYEGVSCEMDLTDGVPTVFITANVELVRNNGDKIILVSHMVLDPLINEISGYNEYIGGTGRFEGVTGECNIINGVLDPDTGIASWEEVGEITLILKD